MTPVETTLQIDVHGRVQPSGLKAPAHPTSRRYFQIEQQNWPPEAILNRLQNHLGISTAWTVAAFVEQVEQIKARIRNDATLAPLLSGAYVPFILPRLPKQDLGSMLEQHYLPAVGQAFEAAQPGGRFVNHVSHSLTGKLSAASDSRHQEVINATTLKEVVGLYFPCLTEYSVPAAREVVSAFPADVHLSGGIDTAAALVAAPDLLIRTTGYPPLLWLSGLIGEIPGIGYHFEPYGLNLTFNRRAHLELTAEYWWSGLTVLGDK